MALFWHVAITANGWRKTLLFDKKSLFQKYPGAYVLQHTQKYILEPESSLHQEGRTWRAEINKTFFFSLSFDRET